MTLQQLQYLAEVANAGSINKAASKLYVSQSTISSAIKDLETEFGIVIFARTNKGVQFTEKGFAFYENILPIIEQKQKVARLYAAGRTKVLSLSISTQHYPFCAEAFTHFLQSVTAEEYELRLKETNLHHIIEDVSNGRSDLGIIFLSNSSERFIRKVLETHKLQFHLLHIVKPHVFLRIGHPLASQAEIDTNDLKNYPYVIFDREPGLSSYYSEELTIENFTPSGKIIYINDRSTVYSVLTYSDAFSLGSGLLPAGHYDQKVTAVPLKDPTDEMQLGYIKTFTKEMSRAAQTYVDLLAKCIKTNRKFQ